MISGRHGLHNLVVKGTGATPRTLSNSESGTHARQGPLPTPECIVPFKATLGPDKGRAPQRPGASSKWGPVAHIKPRWLGENLIEAQVITGHLLQWFASLGGGGLGGGCKGRHCSMAGKMHSVQKGTLTDGQNPLCTGWDGRHPMNADGFLSPWREPSKGGERNSSNS